MNVVQVFLHCHSGRAPVLVGRLAFKGGQALFEYEQSFLDSGLNISPLQLGLQGNLQIADRVPFGGLHGVFADSLPDGWGLLLMDRVFRQRNINIQTITPLDRLAYMGTRAMGALSYVPDTGEETDQALDRLSLSALADESLRILQGDSGDVLKVLAMAGGSPGGARPKVAIGLKGGDVIAGVDDLPESYTHWVVKFPAGASQEDVQEGLIEYLYSILARKAGINFPETTLFPAENSPGFFGIKRFDRGEGNHRVHMHSLAGMINADFRLPDCDYETLLKATSVVTKHHQDACEVFRRMVFNIIMGNRDDHTKNFSYLMSAEGEWRLSPAYDVTFNGGINGQHSMSVNGLGKSVTLAAVLGISDLIPLDRKSASLIIEQVIEAASAWTSLANEYGVPENLNKEITCYIDSAVKRLRLPAHR